MSYYQLRGVTGITPRRNDMAEVYQRSALLPAMKQAEFSRATDERAGDIAEKGLEQNQRYYTQMAGLQDDANEAAEKDRNRGLWLQGGMTGIAGYNALNDAVGGNLAGKAVGAIKDVFTPKDVVSPVKDLMGGINPGMSSAVSGRGVGNAIADSYGWGQVAPGALGAVGDFGKEYIADPLKSAGKNIVKWAGDAGSGIANFFGGLFS